MGVKRVSPEEVKNFYRLYEKLGTYEAVAKATGRSASTIARYIKAGNLSSLSIAGRQSF